MDLSIVVPVFNEEESLAQFYKELNSFSDKDLEIIFIDDGSSDKTLEILKGIEKKDKRVSVFSFRKNRGKAEALTFGFDKAKGEYIATLDADLQDAPSQISILLSVAKSKGWDLVCGWRKNRKDPFFKVISSKIFNKLTGVLCGLLLHDYNCGLKVYKREAVKSLTLYGGLHRFIPFLVYNQGFSVTEVAVEHRKRLYGKSKYGFSKLWKDLPDMFTMLFLTKYSKKPFHFFGFIGLAFLVGGFGILIYLTVSKIFLAQGIGDRPILFLGILLVLGGFQVLFTGFLADLIINISYKHEKEVFLKYSSDRE